MSETNETEDWDDPAPKKPVLVPRKLRRKPKTRYTLQGLLKSKTFWFNTIITITTAATELTTPIREIVGDHATSLLILFAGVVNIYLRVRTTVPTAALVEKGRDDIEAAKQGK